MMLEVIHELSYGVLQIWGWSAFCLWRGSARRGGVLHRIYHEVKPFYLPVLAIREIGMAMTGHGPAWVALMTFDTALWYANWRAFHNVDDDDDRWKRRKAKLVEKVRALGGRLVAEPAAS
jgi:hypothetical protein